MTTPHAVSTAQLRWLQSNRRAGASPPAVVGVVAEEVMRECRAARSDRLAAVWDTVARCAGEDWLGGIVGLRLRRDVLEIAVGEANERYHLRLRWEQRLLAALARDVPAAGIRSVRFVMAPREV